MSKSKSAPAFLKGITGKDVFLSLQHMFAMLGATVTVPLLSGMSIPLALLSAGVGTIIFYFCAQRKVPVFLGSSFAFLPGLITIMGQSAAGYSYNATGLAAMIALVIAGLVYVAFSFIIKAVGVERVKKFFPPIVVGPVIIIIGMNLAGSMFFNNIIAPYAAWGTMEAWQTWTTALITALTIVVINAFAKPKSFLKVVPIVIGFLVGYIYGMCIGIVDLDPASPTFIFSGTASGNVIIFQQAAEVWGFWGAWGELSGGLMGTAILCIVPIAIVTFMEHLGDINANSIVAGKDFMVDPGLDKTVLGDGLGTIASALLGGPANTTYGENTAVLAITKNYNPRNIFMAACFAVFLGLFIPFGEFLGGIPTPVVGGACVVLFGMISANGLRSLIDAKVDMGNTKNLIVVSVTLAVGLGIGAMELVASATGNNAFQIGFNAGDGFVKISALAIATVLAIVLNLVIPNSKEVSDEEKAAEDAAQMTLTSASAFDIEGVEKEIAEEKAIEEEASAVLDELSATEE